MPDENLELNYLADVDLLSVRFSKTESTYRKDDMEKGLIYNYDSDDFLVSIEILDIYGIFV